MVGHLMARRWLDQAELHHLLQQRLLCNASALPATPQKVDTTALTAHLKISNEIVFPDQLILLRPTSSPMLYQIGLPTHSTQHLVAARSLQQQRI